MRDLDFQRKLNTLSDLKETYLAQLARCEKEYQRRYGAHPSNWDDDFWIDFAHTSGEMHGRISVAQVKASALLCEKMTEAKARRKLLDEQR
jgi:hypothetical protein